MFVNVAPLAAIHLLCFRPKFYPLIIAALTTLVRSQLCKNWQKSDAVSCGHGCTTKCCYKTEKRSVGGFHVLLKNNFALHHG